MQTHTINTYTFSELSEDIQEKVLEKYYNWNTEDSFWHECVIDDCKEIAEILGIEIDNIYFSGFWNQGDGACFEGFYSYKKGSVKAIKEYAPQEFEVHKIAEALQALQKPFFYGLTASVRHSGHYSHEYCTRFSIQNSASYYDFCVDSKIEDALTDILRDFMRWIYKRLESEYEYQTSKDALQDSFECNEVQFTKDGRIYNG